MAVPKAEVTVLITQRITVDAEIADEIVWLNEQGVRTEGSCAAHGETAATAMITASSVERARGLGYAPAYVGGNDLFEMELRAGVVKQQITLESVCEQPYEGACFRAGRVEGHDVDEMYFELEREGKPQLTVLLRDDEALALIWVMSGAVWSGMIGEKEKAVEHGSTES